MPEKEGTNFFDILLEATSHWSVYRRFFVFRFFKSIHVNAFFYEGIIVEKPTGIPLFMHSETFEILKLRCTFLNHRKNEFLIFPVFFSSRSDSIVKNFTISMMNNILGSS